MDKKNDSYSDLERARRLSQQLSVLPDKRVEKGTDEIEYSYASFEQKIINNEDSVVIQAVSEKKPDEENVNESTEPEVYPILLSEGYQDRSEFWNELVKWAGEVTMADPVFICQSGGMLVALNGDSEDIEPEALGGRMLNMFDQAEKISKTNNKSSSISLELDKNWVTGIMLEVNEEPIILVLVTINQLKESIISAVKRELSQFLNR